MSRTTVTRALSSALLLALLTLTLPARAHIGNKDVFQQQSAGPYKLFVTIRTPTVIPGVAIVEVRASADSAHVQSIRITPIPLTGEASKHPPSSDPMQPSPDDPAFFTGSLWLMASGSWQVRLEVEGSGGPATAGVPVPAEPLSLLPMQRSLGITLAVLGIVLTLGMSGIVAAAVRESRLAPGLTPTPDRRQRAAIAGAITLVVLAFAIAIGNKWWNVEAAGYARDLYRPADLHATLTGDRLDIQIGNYNVKQHEWKAYALDDLLTDHGHLMHLYAIRWPQMDAAFHLHPEPDSNPAPDINPAKARHLSLALPAMPPGAYHLYADIVLASGLPETLTGTLTIPPGLPAAPLAPDDASALPPPLSAANLGLSYKLPDGYAMLWDRPPTIAANTGYTFRFRLLDRAGNPASDVRPYLGMAGHAAFVKDDGTAFAHTHPEGSASMVAMALANPAQPNPAASSMAGGMDDMPDMPGMASAAPLSPTVDFTYGFPSPGRYRIFIQMKHSSTVETGVFDAEVK